MQEVRLIGSRRNGKDVMHTTRMSVEEKTMADIKYNMALTARESHKSPMHQRSGHRVKRNGPEILISEEGTSPKPLPNTSMKITTVKHL